MLVVALYEKYWKKITPNKAFGGLAALLLFWATFQVWHDEYDLNIAVVAELNPDELLNQDVKTNALGRVRPVNVQEMMGNVRSYLRITQARPKLVKNYFRERHVQYAAH